MEPSTHKEARNRPGRPILSTRMLQVYVPKRRCYIVWGMWQRNIIKRHKVQAVMVAQHVVGCLARGWLVNAASVSEKLQLLGRTHRQALRMPARPPHAPASHEAHKVHHGKAIVLPAGPAHG